MADQHQHRATEAINDARALVKRAQVTCAAAAVTCESARFFRSTTTRSRALRPRLATDILHALDKVSSDLDMLKTRIDTARQDALAPHLKRRSGP